MEDSIPPEILSTAASLQPVPRMEDLASIYREAEHLANLQSEYDRKSEELQALKDDIKRLSERTLPALFDAVHGDKLGIPGWNADIVLKQKIHASISQELPEEQREAAFAEVERMGGEDMIKLDVSVQFPKGEFELAAEFVRYVRTWNRLAGHTVSVKKAIHWQTLTKWVSDLVDRNAPIRLDKVGAQIRRFCVVEYRKERGPRG